MMGNETPGMSYVCADEFVLIDDLRNPSPVPFDASSLHSPRAVVACHAALVGLGACTVVVVVEE